MTALARPVLPPAESISAIPGAARLSPSAWNRLAHRGFHRHHWFVTAEQCGWRPRHLAIEGPQGIAVLVPVYLADGRTPNDLLDRWLGPSRASLIRAALGPRPTLSVQSPFSLASDLLGDASSLSDATLHRMFEALEQQAAADDALAVVWPFIESDFAGRALLRVGRERGYVEVYAGATARLRVQWGHFEGYLGSRSKNVRRTIREDLKTLAASGARLTSSSEFQRAAGAMDRLYRRAYRRRNRRESALARDFFHRLAETPSLDVVAQLTWRGARLTGMSLNLPTAGLEDGTFAAFEESDVGGPAYYNDLIYEPLRRACRERIAELDLGPTALYAKVLRGAVLRPRTTLIRGTTPLAHRTLRALGSLVSRRQAWKERRALGQLWGPRCFEEAE